MIGIPTSPYASFTSSGHSGPTPSNCWSGAFKCLAFLSASARGMACGGSARPAIKLLENGSLQGERAWASVRDFLQYFTSAQCHPFPRRMRLKTSPTRLHRHGELFGRMGRNPVY
jgi:hypothetical protein